MANQSLRTQAIKAAHPFGGCALLFQEDVIRDLEADGLVEVVSYNPCDSSLNYVLTPKGKIALKAI